jgi:hypothetical protein
MQRISRRQKVCFIAFLFLLALNLAGCAIQWVSEATGIIAALGPAINAILLVLTAAGAAISPDVFSTIQSASQEATNDLNNVILPLINQYNTALGAAGKVAILTQINDAIEVVIQNWAKVLPALHIDDPAVQAKAEALVGAVEAELQSLQALIPVLQGVSTMEAFHAAGHTLPLNKGQFNKAFSRLLAFPTGNLAVDAAAEQIKL